MENSEKIEETEVSPLELDFLNDVKLKIHASVGKTSKMLLEIVSLKEGDIIELDTNIDGYIKVHINSQTFALGEMVIANDKYGVRIIDLA